MYHSLCHYLSAHVTQSQTIPAHLWRIAFHAVVVWHTHNWLFHVKGILREFLQPVKLYGVTTYKQNKAIYKKDLISFRYCR